MKNRSEEGFGILISPGSSGEAPGANLLPALLSIAQAEQCSLLGHPMPDSPTRRGPPRPRTLPSFLYPAADHPKCSWAFFVDVDHKAGEVDPSRLPKNQMTVDEVRS